MKILIAEDENISRMVLAAALKKRGHEVVAVENGRKAWEAFQKDYFPVLISDWLMPEMDGPAAVRQIRILEQARGILPASGAKIIMVTAVGEMKDVIRSFQEFCDAYLVRPVDLRELLGHLKTFDLI